MFKQDFVETKLVTKFAEFNVRVYRDHLSKETFVLRTQNLDTSQPVLVRVHSECLTGDMFGSLHCDCGKQLTKSLQIISEEGGVLIYLRQEGRGTAKPFSKSMIRLKHLPWYSLSGFCF